MTTGRWPDQTAAEAPTVHALRGGRVGWLPRSAVLPCIVAVAILVRIAVLVALGDLPLRADEVQYQELAVNLVEGRGFALDDRLTSWRPPLYPFALAAVYTLTGSTDPASARGFQIALSALTVLLVYLLGRRLFGETTGLLGAGILAVYPSLVFYNAHLLTEGLATFMVTLTLYSFALYVERPRVVAACATGVSLGLAALSRDVILPLAVPLALIMVWPVGPRRAPRLVQAAAFLLAVVAVVGPWVMRNTLVQGTLTSISTNGGPAILAGNNAHTPLDRPWQYHDFALEQRWRSLVPGDVTEGQRQRIAVRLGLQYMWEHPGLTVQRALVKAGNVWGLERDIVGTMLAGHYGEVSRVAVMLLAAVIFGGYAVTLLAGIVGLVAAVRGGVDRSFHLLVVVLVVLVTAVHAIAFGHPRYHLPLMPIFCVYAGHAWTRRATLWRERRSPALLAAGALVGLALLIWAREILLVELHRVLGALKIL